MFFVFLEKRMAMQPMFKKIVKRHKAYLPPLRCQTYRHGMASNYNEVAVTEHCLQKTCLQKIAGGLFHADRLALIPMSFPALPESDCVLRR
jgi:hypothetical protein